MPQYVHPILLVLAAPRLQGPVIFALTSGEVSCHIFEANAIDRRGSKKSPGVRYAVEND